MRADLDRQLKFPQEIISTTLHPDIVLWSSPMRTAAMEELTVPWEDGRDSTAKRKKEKYTDPAGSCHQAWSSQ